MASHPADFGRAPAPPLRRALALIPSLPRPMLSRFVARAIERLDQIDGDPDLEDATGEEDAFEGHNERFGYDGPGCPVADVREDSDPGECNGDPEHEDGRVAIYGLDQSRGPIRFARVSDLEQPYERRLPWSDFNLSV